MTTPTKTVVNVQTGEVIISELEGEELTAYEAAVAQENQSEQSIPEPTLAELVAQLQEEVKALKGL